MQNRSYNNDWHENDLVGGTHISHMNGLEPKHHTELEAKGNSVMISHVMNVSLVLFGGRATVYLAF